MRRPDAICPADAAGGGECPLNFCGQLKVGLPSNQFPQSGDDADCGGRSCVVGPELATGDGFQLTLTTAHGHTLAGPNWEIYGHWVDEWNRDPTKIRTEVFYLLK